MNDLVTRFLKTEEGKNCLAEIMEDIRKDREAGKYPPIYLKVKKG